MMTEAEERAIWDAWYRGESRCPYCIDACPREWHVRCDCFMAPEPPPDHECPQCELVENDLTDASPCEAMSGLFVDEDSSPMRRVVMSVHWWPTCVSEGALCLCGQRHYTGTAP